MTSTGTIEHIDEIAIIGMAGRFPGAKNVEQFWQNLSKGVDSISLLSVEEILASGRNPAMVNDPDYVRARGILEDAELFDASFFGFSPREAELTDPQQRVFLECAYEALETAGYNPDTYPGAIGVFAGQSLSEYLFYLYSQRSLTKLMGGFQTIIGNDKDYLATRASYKLNLRGPSISVGSACSTSLVAVCLACQSLLNAECDIVLAGGVAINFPQKVGQMYTEGGVSSPDGRCRAFDAKAQGTVGGSGVGLVVLKRLVDALDDGDNICAVIKGTAVNNDGAMKVGYTAPSVDGQANVIKEALAMARITPETVGYVEAHGTATPLGDPIEVAALTRAFRVGTDKKGFCAIGSVKTNIGHLDVAAGVAGLIKTTLALQHKTIPPSLHFEQPNPKIDFDNSPFYVSAKPREWKKNGAPRRAGVSSFGIGGTNSHVIVEESPEVEESGPSRTNQLILLSAKTETALENATSNLAQYLKERPNVKLADVAYTLQVGRRVFDHRRAVVCKDVTDAVEALESKDKKRVLSASGEVRYRPMVFMFPGQGAQYVNMGRELYEQESKYRDEVDKCCEILKRDIGFDLKAALYPKRGDQREGERRLKDTDMAQMALFVVEYSLARQLEQWGVIPEAMIGHSLGEYVAATLAGVLTLEEGLKLVAARGRLMQSLPSGAMLAVGMEEEELRALIAPGLSIAAVNAPKLCVASGREGAIKELESELERKGVFTKLLGNDFAFHSEMVEPILEQFKQEVEKVNLNAPGIKYVSNVTGTWISPAEVRTAEYWGKHMRGTVKFREGIEELLKGEGRIFLEVGPGRALSGLVNRIANRATQYEVIHTLGEKGEGGDQERMLKALGRFWLAGAKVDWKGFVGSERRRRMPLPTYPFERQAYLLTVPPAPVSEGAEVNGQQRSHRATAPQSEKTNSIAMKEKEAHMPTQQSKEEPASTRREMIAQTLKVSWSNLLGVDSSRINTDQTCFELGFDSLLLIQVSHGVREKFGLKVPFRRLFEELTTIDLLSAYIDQNLAPEQLAAPEPVIQVQQSAPQTLVQASTLPAAHPASIQASMVAGNGGHAAPHSAIDVVISQQLQVMSQLFSQQLEILRGNGSTAKQATVCDISPKDIPALFTTAPSSETVQRQVQTLGPVKAEAPAEAIKTKSNNNEPEPYVPYQTITPGAAGGLTSRQQRHLENLIDRYTNKTKNSKRHTADNRRYLSDNRALLGFRLLWKEMVYPIVADRSLGSRLWDLDGNEYVDLTMGFGVHLFGHSPSFIMSAIQEQLEMGLHLGPQSNKAGEVARLISEMTGAERVAFCNSGTEAVMSAIRLARAVTGRRKIATFAGSYHGTFDGTLGRLEKKSDGSLHTLPLAPGVGQGATDDLLMLYYDKQESLDILRAQAKELAAILVEPVQSRRPDIQPKAFLRELRALTKETGTALVFDDMITGFRIDPGGTQAWFGVQADIATYGKVIGGGLPLGVLAGSREYLDAIDGGMWNYGDGSYPLVDQTIFAGTFCKHPLAMAASYAALNYLKEQGPGLQRDLNERASKFVQSLNTILEQNQVPIRVVNFGSLMRFLILNGPGYMDLFFYHLVEKGVFIWEGRTAFLSTAHTDEDLNFVLRAFEETIAEMREGGFLPEPAARDADGRMDAVTLSQTIPASTGADRVVPVTEQQRQLWGLAQMGEDASCAYNESMVLRLYGQVSVTAMRRAVEKVVERHEAFRTTFSPDGQYQRISTAVKVETLLTDFSATDVGKREEEVSRWLANEARQPFDLEKGPLMRVNLLKLEDEYHILTVTAHHIVFDGWSSGVLLNELHTIYLAEIQAKSAQLPEPMPFARYAERQASQEQAGEIESAEGHWLNEYSDYVPVLELPTDRPRPSMQTHSGARQRLAMDASWYGELKDFSAQQKCSLFTALLAGFGLLLHQLSEQDDVIVGIHSAGQSSMTGGSLVGYCINLLPLRSRINAGAKFSDYLANIKAKLLDAYENQNYPFARLIKKLKLRRDPSRSPMVVTVFNLDKSGAGLSAFGMKVDIDSHHSGFSKWELSWNIIDTGAQFIVECDYNSDLFDPKTVQHWIKRFELILRTAISQPEATLYELKEKVDLEEKQRRNAAAKDLKAVNLQKLKKVRRESIAVGPKQ